MRTRTLRIPTLSLKWLSHADALAFAVAALLVAAVKTGLVDQVPW